MEVGTRTVIGRGTGAKGQGSITYGGCVFEFTLDRVTRGISEKLEQVKRSERRREIFPDTIVFLFSLTRHLDLTISPNNLEKEKDNKRTSRQAATCRTYNKPAADPWGVSHLNSTL